MSPRRNDVALGIGPLRICVQILRLIKAIGARFGAPGRSAPSRPGLEIEIRIATEIGYGASILRSKNRPIFRSQNQTANRRPLKEF